MRMAGRIAIVLSLSLLLASCVQPVRYSARDESFMREAAGRKPWRKVAVLPFSGDAAYRRVAAEWLAFRVRRQGLLEVVDPSLVEIELRKKGIAVGETRLEADDALKAGRLLGVDGVLFGSVNTGRKTPPGQGPPAASAGIVDAATGKVVGTSIRSEILRARGIQDHVMAAVDRIADDLAPVLHAAAGRTWTPPRTPEIQGQEAPGAR